MPFAASLSRAATRAAVSIALLAATPLAEAQTQAPCANRDQIVARLEAGYGETLQSMGLNQNSSLLEVYASEETGTWTILVTRPDGIACLIAAGQMWDGTPAPARARGNDA